jgi:hypothetical protein
MESVQNIAGRFQSEAGPVIWSPFWERFSNA